MRITSKLTTVAALLLAWTEAGALTMVRPLPVAEVAAGADRIVHARVAGVVSGRDESGLPATWITFDVARTLKGPATGRLVTKEFGTAEPLSDGTAGRVAGMPRYVVGEEVVVFLRPTSKRGFSSPVGLGQGVYRVHTDAHRRVVADGGKATDLDAFLSKVEALTGWGR